MLGFEYVGHQRLWRPTHKKFWRVAKALEYVLGDGVTPSGQELERLTGHVVAMVMLRRDLLSLFLATYQFIRQVGRRRAPLWPSVCRELRWSLALLPAIVAHSDHEWLPVAAAYDASECGLGAAESLWGQRRRGPRGAPA